MTASPPHINIKVVDACIASSCFLGSALIARGKLLLKKFIPQNSNRIFCQKSYGTGFGTTDISVIPATFSYCLLYTLRLAIITAARHGLDTDTVDVRAYFGQDCIETVVRLPHFRLFIHTARMPDSFPAKAYSV